MDECRAVELSSIYIISINRNLHSITVERCIDNEDFIRTSLMPLYELWMQEMSSAGVPAIK